MQELFRTRDVVVLSKGDAYTVAVDTAMRSSGWDGGQGVKWVQSTKDEFLVSYSDGLYGGLLLWGSDEPTDQYIAYLGQQVKYGYATMCAGGWVIATKTFEQYTWASRQSGPLVPITYVHGERLVLSLRGLLTNEDEWTLSGDPRGANTYYMASVIDIPRPNERGTYYIMVQTNI